MWLTVASRFVLLRGSSVVRVTLLLMLWPALGAGAQNVVPSGTVLPALLTSSINSQKSKPGCKVTLRLMQDVPLPGSKIAKGARILGQITSVVGAQPHHGAEITLRFDQLKLSKQVIPISVHLRALASTSEVMDAAIPLTGPDRGTPFAWANTIQVGGDAVYGEGGPVMRGDEQVGHAVPNGVLARIAATPGGPCHGAALGDSTLQALGVFSSGACGLYGLDNLRVVHAGRTAPSGEITLQSGRGRLLIRGGSGFLLRTN